MNIKQDVNVARKPVDLEQKYKLSDIIRNERSVKVLSKEMATKVTKVSGKELSTNDFTNSYKNKLDGLLDYVYPVGSIYISVSSTSPATLFGGTWEAIKGRFLLATGTPDNNTNTTYGSNLTYNGSDKYNEPAGTTGGESMHKLTIAQMPSHSHTVYERNNYTYGGSGDADVHWNASGSTAKSISSTGGDGFHNNMPPFLSVYMWKRIS